MNTTDTFVTLTGTATFCVVADGRSRQSSADVTVQKPPWGSTSVVWLGGKGPTKLGLTLYVASGADLATLEDRRGEAGTLTYPEGAFTVVLQDVSAGEYLVGGQQMVKTTWIVTN